MKYKICLSTYDPDIVAALSCLGYKKAEFIEQALGFFLHTRKGKRMMKLIVDNATEIKHGAVRTRGERPGQKAVKEGGNKISIDNFLG
ncbi:MAG: hypothetical protein M0024_09415 [Nitrospiraceae bacterium]|nr:hypothetical protein [Nitrospiraceae bacterium]